MGAGGTGSLGQGGDIGYLGGGKIGPLACQLRLMGYIGLLVIDGTRLIPFFSPSPWVGLGWNLLAA